VDDPSAARHRRIDGAIQVLSSEGIALFSPTHCPAMRPAFLSCAVAAAAAAGAAAVITGGVITAPVVAPASPRDLVAVLARPAAADTATRAERRRVTSWFR